MNSQPCQQFPYFLNLVSLRLPAGMRAMGAPLLGLQLNFHPGAFTLKNIAAESLEQRFDVRKHDGRRSGQRKQCCKGLLVP